MEEEGPRSMTKTRPRWVRAAQQRRARDRGERDADAWAQPLCHIV
jgi:hypothetical protein